MTMEKVLEVKDLRISFDTFAGKVNAIRGVSFDLYKGETLAIVGESGSGKSVTTRSIMRLLSSNANIDNGEILFKGQDIVHKTEKQMQAIRGKEIAMIFQDPMTSLNPVMTVGEQIAEVIEIHENIGNAAAFEKAKEMLELVGIPGARANDYPHQFSGGMKQRVVIAIALACNPKLLIADEPTTALDVTIQAQVLDLMNDLKEKFKTAMILITHDLGVVAQVCDKVAIMYAGEVVEAGTLRDVYLSPKHPYTHGLFGSIPSLDEEATRLKPIQGLMPDPTALPSGCKFHPRCPHATELCATQVPKVTEVAPGHKVRCLICEGQVEFKAEEEDKK